MDHSGTTTEYPDYNPWLIDANHILLGILHARLAASDWVSAYLATSWDCIYLMFDSY